MTEEFLHYIWKFKLLNNNLRTINGDIIEIINPGLQNLNAGPDFTNSLIKINDTIWAGNIEIHINASDWLLHNHQNDMAYNNIILHVVFSSNRIILRKNGEEIPQLELKNGFDSDLFEKYQNFLFNKNWIPCEKTIMNTSEFTRNNWIEYQLISRLERKTLELKKVLEKNKNNWEDTFYQQLAKNFGFKLNEIPFELLANSLPLKYLAKHKNNEIQLAARIFGQSGLLHNGFIDDYPMLLNKEYLFLNKKYKLNPIQSHLWKFLRLRPSNFPTIRLSQFVNLIYTSSHLFSKIIESKTIVEIFNLFEIKAFQYFDNHYLFDEKTNISKPKYFGKSAVELIIINTIVPFLFLYSKEKNEKKFQNRALSFLEQLDPEKNAIIKKWENIGIKAASALQTQGLIELKHNYCDYKKCLDCRIGNELIRKKSNI